MPSSTSNSDYAGDDEPCYERPLPKLSAVATLGVATLVWLIAMGAWEVHWRQFGATPAIRNSDSLWAAQRRRIDHGEGASTVIVGSSRLLFDLQLGVWERLSGQRPIQLALEGTSPVTAMEDLAADPDFTGRLIVGVAPDLFFSGYENRADAFARYRTETLAQRSGQWLSQTLLEPWLAFCDDDFALFTVLARQAWPMRPGVPVRMRVRKLSVGEADRATHMWSKVENDPEYADLARRIWAQNFNRPPPDDPEAARKHLQTQIDRASAAVRKLRERGVPVVFVRSPSDGDYLAFEERTLPRAQTWDVLLQTSGAPGIHFQDYPQLQGYRLPEWSHMTRSEAERYTEALQPLVERELAAQRQGG